MAGYSGPVLVSSSYCDLLLAFAGQIRVQVICYSYICQWNCCHPVLFSDLFEINESLLPFPFAKKTTSISIVQRRTHLSGQNSKSRHRSSLLNQKPITTRAEMWPSRQLKPDWVWWLRRRLLSHSGLHWGGAALRRETGRWGNFAPPVHLSCCWPSFKQLPKTFETAAKSCQKVVRALLIFWQSYPFNVDDVDCA